jgi:hypothetical protein
MVAAMRARRRATTFRSGLETPETERIEVPEPAPLELPLPAPDPVPAAPREGEPTWHRVPV